MEAMKKAMNKRVREASRHKEREISMKKAMEKRRRETSRAKA